MSPISIHRLARATRALVTWAVAAAALGLAGCASPGTPPPPADDINLVVVRPPRPDPNAMWVQGHYVYKSGRYHWVPGHWTRR